jgi:SSS family solute:Na+ symporter
MNSWLIVFTILYVFALVLIVRASKSKNSGFKEYLLGGKIGVIVGFLTFSATLFSTFTLMGMPDFFRTHGVGAWIFLGVTDTAMAFIVLRFGLSLREKYNHNNYLNVSSIIVDNYGNKFSKYVYWSGIFIFLIPYVAIQIKGIADFLGSSGLLSLPPFFWGLILTIIIVLYSSLGGFRAIVLSDTLQGIILFIATIIIGAVCIHKIGGINSMFDKINEINPQLLSTPGPKKLFTYQYLISSFIVISIMPISQPQLFTRIVLIEDKRFKSMVIATGIFAFLIILPTIFIGLYGAILYPDHSDSEFWYFTLIRDQPNVLSGLIIVGLFAAAMSTADSQLFALQSEVLRKQEKINFLSKLPIVFFAALALVLATISHQELVILARYSFAGTALLVPLILAGVFTKKKLGMVIPIAILLSLLVYLISISSKGSIIPNEFLKLRLDILLLVCTSLVSLVVYWTRNKS